MRKEEEREYVKLYHEFSSSILSLSSRVVGEAVNKGMGYRVAHYAVKEALYYGLFASILREMKNNGTSPEVLKLESAFTVARDHELIGHELIKLVFEHLQTLDKKYIWSIQISKRMREPSDG
jgi:hypothetical protein